MMHGKHAYLIMTHADEYLLQVLISMLDDKRNDIYIHADSKWASFAREKFSTQHAGLYILSHRLDGRWGDISLMHIEYELYRTAYARGGYDYYHLLSGSDLPIKSQDYIHSFFADQKGKPFISYWNYGGSAADTYYKVSRYAFGMRLETSPLLRNRYLNIAVAKMRRVVSSVLFKLLGEREDSKNFFKGANWSSLPAECVELLLAREKQMMKRLRWTRNGEEVFAQTILWQDYFAPKGIPMSDCWDDLRFVNWQDTPHSPDIFRMKDFSEIQKSRKLFARKFSSTVDRNIIDLIQSTFTSNSKNESNNIQNS